MAPFIIPCHTIQYHNTPHHTILVTIPEVGGAQFGLQEKIYGFYKKIASWEYFIIIKIYDLDGKTNFFS